MTQHDANGSVPALRTDRLGRRYGKAWGLRDCTLEVPAGAVAALVGPNGAGKTTLLEMIIGLLEPTEGQVSVFGEASRADTAETLARVGYVAQDHPLYRDFTVADMFHLGRAMNPGWDQELAAARMDTLGIPLQRKVKSLSGGQRAQVSLTMALAKRAAGRPRRAGLQPRPGRPAGVHAGRDGPAADAPDLPDLLARGLGAGTVLRLADRPGRRARAARRPGRRPARRPPAADRPARDPGRRAARDGHSPHRQRPALHRAGPRRRGPAGGAGSTGWQADPVSFEQLVMGYLQRRTPVTTQAGAAGPNTKAVPQ